jgi:cell division protein FtsB
MTTSEFLLTANSLLLALVGILLGVVGFFLKGLHGKFEQLVERVNQLYTELSTEATTSRLHRDQKTKEMDNLADRVNRLETHILNKQA